MYQNLKSLMHTCLHWKNTSNLCDASCVHTQFTEDGLWLRIPDYYDYQRSLLEGPHASSDSTTYGISNRSPLNDIDGFHVANGQLPQDIMHVLFEGVLPMETKLMLNSFINEEQLFTLDTLNERISTFAYGRTEARNRPPKPFTPVHITSGRLHLSGLLLL